MLVVCLGELGMGRGTLSIMARVEALRSPLLVCWLSSKNSVVGLGDVCWCAEERLTTADDAGDAY